VNNFNGDNLLECDQAVLKELGIKKIGDRVRIFVAIKTLRTRTYSKQWRRNRVCLLLSNLELWRTRCLDISSGLVCNS
jgi:mitogen-activated protein kinase kinase kinase